MIGNLITNEKQPEPPVDPEQTEDGQSDGIITDQSQTTPQFEAPAVNELPKILQDETDKLCARWTELQARFVDEPYTTVEQSDELVAEAFDKITQGFTNQQTILRQLWVNHENTSTEDLRIALQKYRSILNRLLEV